MSFEIYCEMSYLRCHVTRHVIVRYVVTYHVTCLVSCCQVVAVSSTLEVLVAGVAMAPMTRSTVTSATEGVNTGVCGARTESSTTAPVSPADTSSHSTRGTVSVSPHSYHHTLWGFSANAMSVI